MDDLRKQPLPGDGRLLNEEGVILAQDYCNGVFRGVNPSNVIRQASGRWLLLIRCDKSGEGLWKSSHNCVIALRSTRRYENQSCLYNRNWENALGRRLCHYCAIMAKAGRACSAGKEIAESKQMYVCRAITMPMQHKGLSHRALRKHRGNEAKNE